MPNQVNTVTLTSFAPLESEVHELRDIDNKINIQDATSCKIDKNRINNNQCDNNNTLGTNIFSSKLYFRNGKVGCYEADNQPQSNVEATHALVKHILANKSYMSRVVVENFTCIDVEENIKNEDNNNNNTNSNSNNTSEDNDDGNEDNNDKDVEICYNELPDVLNEEKNIENIRRQSSTDSKAPSINDNEQKFVREQMHHLVRRFTARTNSIKSRLAVPPSPSLSLGTDSTESSNKPIPNKIMTPMQKLAKGANLFEADAPRSHFWHCSTLCGNNNERTLDPQGKLYISWLCVVSLSFLYNAWVIPMRSSFPFQNDNNINYWLACDFCADIIYLLDVAFFKHRVMYLFEGFWVKDKNLTRINYMRKLQFKLDLFALLPMELLYFRMGTSAVWLRFPRLLKIQSFWEVFRLLDRVISSPHFVRVTNTLTYMLYMIHLTACAYYVYSDYEGLGINRWVFNGKGHPYIRCFAFATKTATSIGKNPKPEREGEFLFMTAAWLMGVFVFALLIGQIRDIISTATRNKNEYRQLEDETLEYMRRLNLPSDVQQRVKMWFKFTWEQQRTLDEANILDSLPVNLKTDIAISVHIQTLSKVQLFSDCEEALLRDLVLKLRAVTFLPGDYVCRHGEVGREMYIIKLGQVQVMGGQHNDVVLATLYEGSVFGEISLLGINGADRRTADVRAKGYANLFVLSKSDLNEVIAYYPSAQAALKRRAHMLIRKNAAREREEASSSRSHEPAEPVDVVIGNPKTPESFPKLLQTVMQALPDESPAALLITRGSKRKLTKRTTLQKEQKTDHMDVPNTVNYFNDDVEKVQKRWPVTSTGNWTDIQKAEMVQNMGNIRASS